MAMEDGEVITILTTTAPAPVPAAPAPVSAKRKKRKLKDPLRLDKKSSKSPRRSSSQLSSVKANSRNLQRRHELARAKVSLAGTTFFKCPTCAKLLSTAYNYFAHQRVHTHEKLCTCDMCGKSFTVSSSLTRHMREVHEKIKDYKCNFCERKLASKVARDEHERTHTDERPHVCDVCGKSFRQRASLSVHKRFHTKSNLYSCKECNRGFPRKQDMERHELTHTDQKPYGCKLCSKTFRSSASAIRHRQTHNESNALMCDVCGESFNQERYLKNHLKKVHKSD